MANTFSDLGGSIFYEGYDGESKVTLIADGTAKAGWLVGQTAGSGTMRGINPTGDLDEFDGICERRYDTDLNTAFTAGVPVDVYYPKAGRKYIVKIKDPGAALYAGEPMLIAIAGTAGSMEKGGNIEAGTHAARLAKDVANGDTYAVVVWGN